MPWRLLRRCLLFALLGLVTSVAVAWGASARLQLGSQRPKQVARGVAVVDQVIAGVFVRRLPAWREIAWSLTDTSLPSSFQPEGQRDAARIKEIGGAAYDIDVAERYEMDWLVTGRRIDDRAAQGLAVRDIANGGTWVTRSSAGWPLLALRCTERADIRLEKTAERARTTVPRIETTIRHAITIPRSPRRPPPSINPPILLPIEPRPGLAINTIFYALLWFGILLIPQAIRRAHRRARGRCPRCGYTLRGQPAPGCPECGHGREEVAKWQSGEVAK